MGLFKSVVYPGDLSRAIMPEDYPNDADGDALRRVASSGNDMDQPMRVDFPVVLPDEATAQQFAEVARLHGYVPELYKDDEMENWDVICVKEIVLTYDAAVTAQDELNTLSKPFGGYSDGWGTLGNSQ